MFLESMKFLFTLLGAVLGGTLVAWFSGYYSEKGKRDLFREEWPKLLDEAYAKARAEEAGKRLATKEDIDNILENVRAVTRETERIKSDFSSDVWRTQWLMNQKRDVYATIIQRMDEKFDVLDEQQKLTTTSMSALEHAAANEPLQKQLAVIDRGLRSSVGLALIFLNEPATSALEKYYDSEFLTISANYRGKADALGDLKVALVEAAKSEFGISPASR